MKHWLDIAPVIEELTEKINKESGPVEVEDWPMRKSVIANRPIQYILGKHTEDTEIEKVEIISDSEV